MMWRFTSKIFVVIVLMLSGMAASGQELDPREEGIWEAQKTYWHFLKTAELGKWSQLLAVSHANRAELLERTTHLVAAIEPGTFEFTLEDVKARFKDFDADVKYECSWRAQLRSGFRIHGGGQIRQRWSHTPDGWRLISGGDAMLNGWTIGE